MFFILICVCLWGWILFLLLVFQTEAFSHFLRSANTNTERSLKKEIVVFVVVAIFKPQSYLPPLSSVADEKTFLVTNERTDQLEEIVCPEVA